MNTLRVGQPLWFYAGGNETVMQSDQPLHAVVTYVHPHKYIDGKSPLVNLAVFGKDGSLWGRPSVQVWDGDGEAPDRGSYVRWMDDEKTSAEGTDGAPNRGEGESYEAFRAREAKWQEQRKAKEPAESNMKLPQVNLGGGALWPGPDADAKAKADREAAEQKRLDNAAKADMQWQADAKAKAEADAKQKAAQADRDARMTKWQGEKPKEDAGQS